MTESGEIIHGHNKMRFENATTLDTESWMGLNSKMKEALRLIEKRRRITDCGGHEND